MKLLLAFAICSQFFLSAPCWAGKPNSDPDKAHAAAVEKAKLAEVVTDDPAHPRTRKPGFWERAWVSAGKTLGSAKKVGSGAVHFVTSPFRKSNPQDNSLGAGWHKLTLSMAVSPETVKVPLEKTIAVSVTVKNPSDSAVQLQFPNSQRIEVLLKSGDKILAKRSEDQKIEDEEGFLVINPGEKLEYSATVSTRDMKVGETYIIEAYFPTFDELRTSRTITPTK